MNIRSVARKAMCLSPLLPPPLHCAKLDFVLPFLELFACLCDMFNACLAGCSRCPVT